MYLLKSLAIAISMYSRIPVPLVEWNKKNMKYAMCFFPVVGVLTGIIQFAAGIILYGHTLCGRIFCSAVMTIIPCLVTGGIHLDGYADTIDALSSYGERDRKLEILKDPHTGAFAVIGLCIYFLASFALWSEAGIRHLPVIACTYVLSRSLSGISVVTFHAAKNSGLLKTFQDGAQRFRVRTVLIIWMAVSAAMMFLFAWKQAIGAVLAALITFGYYHYMSKKYFGGITGDLAGYFLQICELAMLGGTLLGSAF